MASLDILLEYRIVGGDKSDGEFSETGDVGDTGDVGRITLSLEASLEI